MYCGLTNNKLLVFDIRNTKESVKVLVEPCVPRDMSPIHTVEVFENKVLCSNLTRSYSWTEKGEEYNYNPLDQPVECPYDKDDSMYYNSSKFVL